MHRGNFEKIVNYKNWFERENVLNTCILQKVYYRNKEKTVALYCNFNDKRIVFLS